jgi:hypothetical protein
MATSMPPIMPPIRNRASAAVQIEGAKVTSIRQGTVAAATRSISRREPSLEIMAPTAGMAHSEPTPKHMIIKPSSLSSSCRRAANSGIFGAQLPTTKPLARNMSETARRCGDSIGGATKLGVDIQGSGLNRFKFPRPLW